jgi:Ca2+/Na+ antiporter
MKEFMHTPVLITAYVLIAAIFIAYTGIEILRDNTKPRFAHWIGISLCTLWPALVVMALISVFVGRMRLSQS